MAAETLDGLKASVRGIGKAIPDRVVTNAELAQRLGVEPGWIESRTGIRERRSVSPGQSTATLGTEAARHALECAGLAPSDIDVIVVGTCTPEHQFPSTACVVAHALGIVGAAAFDLSAACSGFLYSLAVGAALMSSGGGRRALVIGADVLSRHINFDDPATCPLFGDAAGAAVIERDEEAEPMRFCLGADGAGGEHLSIAAGGSHLPTSVETLAAGLHCIKMSGREVYRSAVRTMSAIGADLGGGGFDFLIAHQANRRILADCAGALGIDMSKVYVNIDRYGNTAGASIPVALCEAWEAGLLAPGDRLLMIAFGGGFTWGGALMRWSLPVPERAAEAKADLPSSGPVELLPVGT